MQPVSDHNLFESQHVLTLVVLSQVWTEAPFSHCRILKRSTWVISLRLTLGAKYF